MDGDLVLKAGRYLDECTTDSTKGNVWPFNFSAGHQRQVECGWGGTKGTAPRITTAAQG